MSVLWEVYLTLYVVGRRHAKGDLANLLFGAFLFSSLLLWLQLETHTPSDLWLPLGAAGFMSFCLNMYVFEKKKCGLVFEKKFDKFSKTKRRLLIIGAVLAYFASIVMLIQAVTGYRHAFRAW